MYIYKVSTTGAVYANENEAINAAIKSFTAPRDRKALRAGAKAVTVKASPDLTLIGLACANAVNSTLVMHKRFVQRYEIDETNVTESTDAISLD
jgi:hypothetical protein